MEFPRLIVIYNEDDPKDSMYFIVDSRVYDEILERIYSISEPDFNTAMDMVEDIMRSYGPYEVSYESENDIAYVYMSELIHEDYDPYGENDSDW